MGDFIRDNDDDYDNRGDYDDYYDLIISRPFLHTFLQVVKSASPILLQITLFGAVLMYAEVRRFYLRKDRFPFLFLTPD